MRFSFGSGGTGGARGGCGSIVGVFFGILLIPAAFYLVYHGEVKLVNHGVVCEGLEMLTPDAAAGMDGQLVKTQGTAEGEFLRHQRHDGEVVYWHEATEEYQQDEDSEGNVEYDWETVDSKSQWAPFKMGQLAIQPDRANAVGETAVFKGFRGRSDGDFSADASDSSPRVGDQRLTVEVIPAGQPLLVVGQVSGGAISGGPTFVVSALDDVGTIAALKTEYKIAYWAMKIGAVIAMWGGIMLIFGPLMALVGWIPFLGERISGALAFGALFLSIVVVGLLTVAIKLFWILVLVVVAGIAFLVWRGVTTPRHKSTPAGI